MSIVVVEVAAIAVELVLLLYGAVVAILFTILLYNCIVVIHFYSVSHGLGLSEALPIAAIDTVAEFRLHAEALQATASEEIAQCPYVAARVGFEPATLRSKGIDSTNAPPRPHYYCICCLWCIKS